MVNRQSTSHCGYTERTLTREEVQAVVDSVIADLESKGIALKK